MHNPLRHLIIAAVTLTTFTACSVTRQSRFVTTTPTLGMDTASASKKFGKPYKIGLTPEREDWYYKENIYAKKWYEVTTVLHFTKGKLTSIEPGEERPFSRESVDVKTVAKD